MNSLKDKVAIVTASSRGIGFGITKAFVAAGAKVYMAVRESEKNIDLVTKLHKENPLYNHVIYNAIDFDSYRPMIQEVIQKEGRLDILVNNFGITNVKEDLTLVDGNPEAYFKILKANIGSVYYASKYAVEEMMKQESGGNIVNISSVAGMTPDVSRLAYTTSKAAINSLTRNIAVQYARSNIRCNAIMPGLVDTDGALDNLSKEFLKTFLQNVPLNRIATPQDIADVAVFLASDDSSFITGELLPVTGGFGLPTPIYSAVVSGKSTKS